MRHLPAEKRSEIHHAPARPGAVSAMPTTSFANFGALRGDRVRSVDNDFPIELANIEAAGRDVIDRYFKTTRYEHHWLAGVGANLTFSAGS